MSTAILAAWAPLEFLSNLVVNWGPGIFLLSVLVVFHEFGHFVVAKRLNVPVNRFSLGFGPRLFGVKKGETDYCVSAFPLGGYVSMAGEKPGPDGEMVQVDHFGEAPWQQRTVIAIAGPVANLIAGYVLMVVVGFVGLTFDDYLPRFGPIEAESVAEGLGFETGQEIRDVDGRPVETWRGFVQEMLGASGDVEVGVVSADGVRKIVRVPEAQHEKVLESVSPLIEPLIGRVAVGFPAYSGGLQDGDRIVSVNGEKVVYWEDLTTLIHASPGKEVDLGMRRGDHDFEIQITPVAQQLNGRTVGVIGITPPRDGSYVFRPKPIDAVKDAFPLTGQLIKQTGAGLWMLASRPQQAKDQVGGPLLILRMSSQQAKRGLSDFLFMMGVISIAIMAFNLLPLPALDGGHVMLGLLEGIRRRPLAQGFLTAYQRLGLALIGFLLVFIIFNDFWREAKRGRAVSRGDSAQSAPSDSR